MKGECLGAKTNHELRNQLVKEGQSPHTAVIGCADSRAPLEAVFDAMPGDLFVLRNAGNTCAADRGVSTSNMGSDRVLSTYGYFW